MKDFPFYLEKNGEVGYADEIVSSVVYASGLPEASPNELVIFETGEIGQVISLGSKYVEILLLSHSQVKVGTRLARAGSVLEVPVGEFLLGNVVSPLGRMLSTPFGQTEKRKIDIHPEGLTAREVVETPFETGVAMVDLVVPLGMGQRELVIGNRKTGKSAFLLQVILNQARRGNICVYAGIGMKHHDLKSLSQFFKEQQIEKNTVLVASNASDPPGLIYLAPYTAMTVAEYFRDRGKNVLVILDDLTTHAESYREISLLARRFPGRNSYPGDIFYIHSRLLERSGNFKNGSITCLPVAESILGDLSGYIQTNLMSMTDGHIYFDNDLYDQGRRPAINPLLSVTRVGLQTQTGLLRDISRVLTGFIVQNDKLRQYLHFGAELSESVRQTLDMGERVLAFLDQKPEEIIPTNINILIFSGLWAGIWRGIPIDKMKTDMRALIAKFYKDQSFAKEVNDLVASSPNFNDLLGKIKRGTKVFGELQS